MIKNKVAFVVFGLISIILFFGGMLGVFFSIKYLNNIFKLEKSEIAETAIITSVINRSRTPNSAIYFLTINENKTYKINLIKIVTINKFNIGDIIEVKFNEEKTRFFIT